MLRNFINSRSKASPSGATQAAPLNGASRFAPSFCRIGLIASLLATTACSQSAAPVDLLGQNTYGRSTSMWSASGYSSGPTSTLTAQAMAYGQLSPAAGPTTQSAAVSSVGVTDLAPPQHIASNTITSSTTGTIRSSEQRINPWTQRPHQLNQQSYNAPPPRSGLHLASDMHPAPARPQAQPASELDSIVSNDGEKTSPAHLAGGFIWPVASHRIISSFGPKGDGKVNDGINIASAEGEPVWASADGEVVYSGNELPGYGNMVLIRHSGGITTAYAHLGRIAVDKYEHVKQGDIIGYVGATGNVNAPQLHFAIRSGKDPVDPKKYLATRVASN